MARLSSLVITGALILAACAAPGSSIGRLTIQGRLVTEDNRPLAGRQIDLLLPAAYGLGGFDLILGQLEDFSRSDRTFSVTTDTNGEFSYRLDDFIYHVTVWIVPPLGAFPRRPPAPYFLIRVPSFPGEYYAVQTSDGRYKIFGEDGAEVPLADASLSALKAHDKPGSADEDDATVGVVELLFPGL